MKEKFTTAKDIIIDSKTLLYLLISIFFLILIVICDFIDSNFSFHDILVEAHGLLFDLIVLGIFITVYETIKSKREEIKKYKEGIDDFRFWKSDEAKYRNKGLIKRLVNLNEQELDLTYCYLESSSFLSSIDNMQKWKFTGAFMKENLFIMSDLTDASFHHSDLRDSFFSDCNLTNCNFTMAKLNGIKFQNCDFKNVELKNSIVQNMSFFQDLKTNNNLNIEDLERKYQIVEKYDRFTIIKK